MDSGAADLLFRARDLVLSGWCQDVDARAADGAEVQPWQATAVAWSLLGSLVAALEEAADHGRELPLGYLAAALRELANFVDDDSLAGWNDDDDRTQADVAATLDAAASAARRWSAD
jgi:hypothetical protein